MSELIDKTIEILERDGWVRGVYTTASGQHCLVGAMYAAKIEVPRLAEEYFHVREAINQVIVERTPVDEEDFGYLDAIEWNDNHAAGVEEVLEVLRTAGERLDREAALA